MTMQDNESQIGPDFYDYLKTEPFPVDMKNFPKFMAGVYDRVVRDGRHSVFLCKSGYDKSRDIEIQDIDVLKDMPYIRTVSVSGLRQDTFAYFIRTYGEQLRAIRFYRNPKVEDWSLLGSLPRLEFVYWYGNRHITSLWDMSGNTFLQGVGLDNFSMLHDYTGLATAPALKYFHVGDAQDPPTPRAVTAIHSLESLAGTRIRHLSLTTKRLRHIDLEVLYKMPYLRVFDFPPELFTTEQVAWMVSNFPRMTGKYMAGVVEVDLGERFRPCPGYVVVGKGKPTLVTAYHGATIEKYKAKFATLVEMYQNVPYQEAMKMKVKR